MYVIEPKGRFDRKDLKKAWIIYFLRVPISNPSKIARASALCKLSLKRKERNKYN